MKRRGIISHTFAVVFDGTSHYAVPTEDLKEEIENGATVVLRFNRFDDACALADELNEECYDKLR